MTRRRGRFAAALAAVSALALAGGDAAAQAPKSKDRVATTNGDGADAHLFRPAVDSKGFLSVNGADILGKGDISLGLIIDYGYGLMPLNAEHGTSYLVRHSLSGTLQFDYGIANLFIVGISAPVVLNVGDAATDVGPGAGQNYDTGALNAQAIGNLDLHAKLRLLRPTGPVPIGAAILVQGGFGAGDSRNFASDPGFFYWPQGVLEARLGSFRLGLNGGYRGHTGANPTFGLGTDGFNELKNGTFQNGNLVTFGGAVSYRLLPTLELVAETYGTELLGGASAGQERLSAEALGGVKLYVEKNSYFTIGGGAGYTKGFEAAIPRLMLGFMFEPSIGDRDGDGIPDDEDDCPDQAEDFDGFQDTKADSPPGKYGCPDPDNDNDGIPDELDACPNVPGPPSADPRKNGCPQFTDGDRDGDGILDSHDKCPDEPEDKDGFEDADGCPDPDNDKDGIPDVRDKCPNDPEDFDGFQDKDGCPDPDNDKDGILDAADSCPNEPETFNGFQDEDGCPDRGRVVIEENNILILDKILFRTGSAEILPESFPIVDAVATTLTHHPEFTLLEVQGHADERGDDISNLHLTQDRSKSVLEALVKKGVERARLRAMGYGEYCPIDPAHVKPAWDKNRRVEFKVVMTATGPTEVVLGCPMAKAKGIASPPNP